MNLKIFKLRSGEEIICHVVSQTKTKVKIKDPLIFKSTTSFDSKGSYDVTILRDWLHNSELKEIEIPKNHVAIEIIPTSETVKLYTLQLDSERSVQNNIVSIDESEMTKELENTEQAMNDFLGAMLSDLAKQDMDYAMEDPFLSAPKGKKRPKTRRSNTPSPEISEGELDRHGIYVSLMIPSEAIMNLITAGLLSPKDLLRMIKEVKKKNRFTGDETDRTDFGNKLSDWNPDPGSDEYK